MPLEANSVPQFEKAIARKPEDMQDKIWDKIELLLDNPNHPSLRVKKVRGIHQGDIWEASVDMQHRLTFKYTDDQNGIVLRNCNGHEVLKKP